MAVVRRRPVPSSNDARAIEILQEKEKQIKQKEIEKEELEQEECNQESEKEQIEEIEEEVMIDNNQEMVSEHRLEDFTAAISKTMQKISTEAGVMSVINSRNGKRITLSKDVMNELNNLEMISISFSDESLAVAERLPNNDNQLKVKSSGNKGVIYSAGLVSEITDKYGLDFSNRTSITFTEVNYVESNGYTVAIIKIK